MNKIFFTYQKKKERCILKNYLMPKGHKAGQRLQKGKRKKKEKANYKGENH